MSKRGHSRVNGADEAEGSRHKRRREVGGSSSDVDITMSSDPAELGRVLSKAEVKEMGTKIWLSVKDAVKDHRSLAEPFLRKPPKRDYPDYYVLIKQPIALDDIKKKLDQGSYATLVAVKDDLELMFGNAKQYNQTDSFIYTDAKDLLKIVNKTYNKLVPSEEDSRERSKPPSLNKLIKARLDKLTSKTDPAGRQLSYEFMELPDKKLWAIYYREIKKPQCFENIYKHIKRKEYSSSAAFAADVELIFSNALHFNQDGTQIYDDAMTLKDYFRQLMSDMPPPHTLPEYAKPSNKIKIRPPTAKQEPATSGSLKLRVPAAHQATSSAPPAVARPPVPAKAAVAPAPTANTFTLPVAPVTAARPAPVQKASTPQVQPAKTQAQPAKKAATPQPPIPAVAFINATASHYPPQAAYAPPIPVMAAIPTMPAAAPNVLRSTSVVNTQQQSVSHSPAPVIVYPPNRQLKSITLRIQPKGRQLTLDHRDGVRSWSIRLVTGETSLLVNEVTYMEEDEDDGSEDEAIDVEQEEEEEDMDVDYDASPSKNGRKKGKGRGRARPPRAAKTAAASKLSPKSAKKKAVQRLGEVQLKLNNFVVGEQHEKTGEWSVYLPAGSNVIEIGEVNGMLWKVFAERIVDA